MSERDAQTQALKRIGDNLATVDSTGESLIESLEGIRLAIRITGRRDRLQGHGRPWCGRRT